MVFKVHPLIWSLFISSFTISSIFGLIPDSLYDHQSLHLTDYQSFPSFNQFTAIDQSDMIPMDSIWSTGHRHVQPPFHTSPHPFLMAPHSAYPSLLDAEPSMPTRSYSQSNEIAFGYSSKGKGSSEIPEDIIDGIVAKVLVDEKLNPIFNPRRARKRNPFRQLNVQSKSSYRKSKYQNDQKSGPNNVNPLESTKSTRPLDNGLQDLSRYVKSLRTVAWDDQRLGKDDGSSSSSYGDSSNFGPVFKTKYDKSDGSYNVYGFLVPMGSKVNHNKDTNNHMPSAYGRKMGYHEPCHKSS